MPLPEGETPDKDEIAFTDQLSINDASSIYSECKAKAATCVEMHP